MIGKNAHVLKADSPSHRIALATLLCLEAAHQPSDIVREGVEFVDPPYGRVSLSQALALIGAMPKPVKCEGHRSSGASGLAIRCTALAGTPEGDGFQRWNSSSFGSQTRRFAQRLSANGHLGVQGTEQLGHMVFLTSDEYIAWRNDYLVPHAWSISDRPTPELRKLGAAAVFQVHPKGFGEIVVREDVSAREASADEKKLASQRLLLIERAMAAISATLPGHLSGKERAERAYERLQELLRNGGFQRVEEWLGETDRG